MIGVEDMNEWSHLSRDCICGHSLIILRSGKRDWRCMHCSALYTQGLPDAPGARLAKRYIHSGKCVISYCVMPKGVDP